MLTVSLEGRELRVQGMVDTANLLKDPVSGRPVVILDSSTLKAFLPSFSGVIEGGAASIDRLPESLSRRVRLIPAETVTGRGLLPALLPDGAYLDAGRGEQAVELLIAPAPLATPKDCKALLPAELLTE